MADRALGVFDRSDDRIDIIVFDLWTLVQHHDLRAVTTHGADRKRFDLASILQRNNALIALQLHGPVAIRLKLPEYLRVLHKVVRDLFYDLRRLVSGAGYYGDVRSGVQNPHGDTAESNLPGLAIPTAFDDHEGFGVAELPCYHSLGVLKPDAQVIDDESILMRPPVKYLLGPCRYVS